MGRSPGKESIDRLRAEVIEHVNKRADELRAEMAEMLAGLGQRVEGAAAPVASMPVQVVAYDLRVPVRTETVLDVPSNLSDVRAAMVVPHGPGRMSVRETELRGGQVRFILDGSGYSEGISVLYLSGGAA